MRPGSGSTRWWGTADALWWTPGGKQVTMLLRRRGPDGRAHSLYVTAHENMWLSLSLGGSSVRLCEYHPTPLTPQPLSICGG